MRLARASQGGAFIPLTPLVDVMLILLVFFMVTSTYLNLDMIPMAGRAAQEEAVEPAAAPGAAPGAAARPATLLLRLGSDGTVRYRGRALGMRALQAEIAARLAASPGLRVVILPSGSATAQALVTATEAATRAGVTNLGVLRLEGGS